MFLKVLSVKICILLLFSFLNCNAQDTQIKCTFPFKLVNNKVLVPVSIGNSRTFDIILDSGFGYDGLILFNKDLADSIQLENRINVQIPGAGDGPPSDAVMSESTTFKSGDCSFNNQRTIVLQNDLFKKSASDGVIGYSYFGHYIVGVDYDSKLITLYDTAYTFNDKEWNSVPLKFGRNNKPHMDISISIKGEEPILIDVYIDYASSLSLELTTDNDMKFPKPDKYEGTFKGYGLSGDVEGKNAYIKSYKIGDYEFSNVTATFFEGNSRSKDKFADGVISNDALRRFNLVFDYQHKQLLIKPNNSFNEKFEFLYQ